MGLRREIVQRKLSKLSEFIDELEPLAKCSYEEYRKKTLVKRSVERLLQLMVEVATDTCDMIIVKSGFSPPKDYHQSFEKAGEHKIISEALSEKLIPFVKLRNIIVHGYEDIKDRRVYERIEPALRDFRLFIKEVSDYIKRHEEEGSSAGWPMIP